MPTAGQRIRALDLPQAQWDTEGTNEEGITDTTYDEGADLVGCAFVAPTSGRVKVSWQARFHCNTATAQMFISAIVREGSSIGAGATVSAAADDDALQTPEDPASGGDNQMGSGSSFRPLSGLTPGASYNAVLQRKVTSGTGDIFYRSIMVEPLP